MPDAFELQALPLKEYFGRVAGLLARGIDLSGLTAFLTQQPFEETRPYLVWRHLLPLDPRFSRIQIVYDPSVAEQIRAVYWDFTVKLSELMALFGQYNLHHEPQGESTAFTFPVIDPALSSIKTRHPQWLTELPKGAGFAYIHPESGERMALPDPEFSFVQFNLKN